MERIEFLEEIAELIKQHGSGESIADKVVAHMEDTWPDFEFWEEGDGLEDLIDDMGEMSRSFPDPPEKNPLDAPAPESAIERMGEGDDDD